MLLSIILHHITVSEVGSHSCRLVHIVHVFILCPVTLCLNAREQPHGCAVHDALRVSYKAPLHSLSHVHVHKHTLSHTHDSIGAPRVDPVATQPSCHFETWQRQYCSAAHRGVLPIAGGRHEVGFFVLCMYVRVQVREHVPKTA